MARGHYRGAPPSGVGRPTLHWRAAVLLSLSPGTCEHGRAAVRIPGSGERGCSVARRVRPGERRGEHGEAVVVVSLWYSPRREEGRPAVKYMSLRWLDLIAFPF